MPIGLGRPANVLPKQSLDPTHGLYRMTCLLCRTLVRFVMKCCTMPMLCVITCVHIFWPWCQHRQGTLHRISVPSWIPRCLYHQCLFVHLAGTQPQQERAAGVHTDLAAAVTLFWGLVSQTPRGDQAMHIQGSNRTLLRKSCRAPNDRHRTQTLTKRHRDDDS